MTPSAHEPQPSLNLEGLRAVLFLSAKKRWFGGVIAGYLAIFVLPASAFLQLPRSMGAIVAFLLSIVGILLRAWSDSIRGDADKLHRANELSRGIGHPIEPAMIADLRYRYSHFERSAEDREKLHVEYYESSSDPSPFLLNSMLRESAWWTAHLAATARNWIYIAAVLGLLAPFTTLLSDLDQVVRAYGALACAVMLTDLFYLGWRYGKLHSGCNSSFREFDQSFNLGMTERRAIISATNYHVIRGTGPLLPDWLWKRQRKKLNDAWSPLSKRGIDGA